MVESLEQRRLLSVTTTVAVGSAVANATTTPSKLLGVNLAYWDDQLSTAQTQQMVAAAGLNQFRFPGGSASDDFHFNVSTNWTDSDANTIPQFAQFIQTAGGTGVVTLDYGSGSPQEAEAELAYLLGSPSDTTAIGNGLEWNDTAGAWQTVNWQSVGYWAGLRAASPLASNDGLNFLRINQSSPFTGIKFFEVGNEEYGSWEVDHHGTTGPGGVSTGAQHDPATYAAFAAALAAFVAADQSRLPSISIGIDSGDPTGNSDGNWTRNVLSDGLKDGFVPGFISDHSYMQDPGNESDSFLLNDTVSDSASVLDWTTRYSDYQTLLQSTLGSSASGVQVMATEFNSVSYNPGKQSTSLVNGLFVADSLGSLLQSGYSGGFVWDLRNGWDTGENNSSSLYGWRDGGDYGLIGDPNDSDPPDTGPYVPYPTYFAEQLVSKIALAGGQAVTATTSSSGISVYAVKEPDGHLDLLVINKSSSSSVTDQFNISGFQPGSSAQVWQYGKTQDTAQSSSSTGASALANSSAMLSLSGSNFSFSFPAYSMTVLDLTTPTVVLNGNSYLELDKNTAGQLDIWSAKTNTAAPTTTYQLSQISSITDPNTAGGVSLFVDFTNGDPLPSSGISFTAAGAPATNELMVVGSTGNDTIAAASNQITMNGAAINFTGVGQLMFTPGAGVDSLWVNSGALTLATPAAGRSAEDFSNISIAAGASLTMTPASVGHTVLVTAGLSLAGSTNAWTGKLDLSNNDLDFTGSSLATLSNQIQQGFNRGTWSGSGITSSTAASDTTHRTTLGIIQNNQGGSPIFTASKQFDGVTPGTSDILIKYTYDGDNNLDGKVDASDYSRIDSGYLGQLSTWFNGDFNYDGVINGSDYTLIDNVFNLQGAALTAKLATASAAGHQAGEEKTARVVLLTSPPPESEPTSTPASLIAGVEEMMAAGSADMILNQDHPG